MLAGRRDRLPVLTYHSISHGPGPTNIAPAIFERQMATLRESGYRSISIAEFIAWHDGVPCNGDPRRVLITFDDARADFATAAHPVLRAHALQCIVFVPTGRVGGTTAWGRPDDAQHTILDWSALRELVAAGVEVGGHGVEHVALTRLAPEQRRHEIETPARVLREQLGIAVRAFAAPFGDVDDGVRAAIARSYDIAFGTRLDCARCGHDRYDVPRIDMHYFRAAHHWRGFLEGRQAYLNVRRCLRAIRNTAMRWQRG